ncbi:hypothetical protein CP974_15640 [Streptomyces fradiae ATCC 10745 = DSM 40063]|nr:hypothetical protein CP974_15640 [Streptomyces fradiae ATCC 10745 = DSM 40063]
MRGHRPPHVPGEAGRRGHHPPGPPRLHRRRGDAGAAAPRLHREAGPRPGPAADPGRHGPVRLTPVRGQPSDADHPVLPGGRRPLVPPPGRPRPAGPRRGRAAVRPS